MKLDYQQALKRIDQVQGVWLLHGAEPLLEQNLITALRADWKAKGIERQRVDLQTSQDWKLVFGALNSLSLFATQIAVEVHGNVKPDAQGLKQLKSFILNPQDNRLIIVLPKQDSKSLKSAFIQAIEANGVVVTLSATRRAEQQQILQQEAQNIGLQLDAEAWQWLLYHHENNLLAARNSLLNLAGCCPLDRGLGIEDLQQVLQDQSRYSSFDLSDACLKGDLPQAYKILTFLLQSLEQPSLIFWALQRDMRLILELFEQPQQAEQLGIWRSKIPLYQQTLRRLNPSDLIRWPALLLQTDCAIKGINQDKVEDLLMQLICAFCATKNRLNT